MSNLMFSVTKDEFEIETFRCGGKGGQNQNKRDTGVRIRHTASGAVSESREFRTQLENKKAAFRKLVASDDFRKWLKVEVARQNGAVARAEAEVDMQMRPGNLRVEGKDEGRWVVLK